MQNLLLAFLLILSLVCPTLIYGQHVSVKGIVQDTEGEALPFANIFVLPDSIVMPSDAEGNFSIMLMPGRKNILISYAGYEIARSIINIEKDTTIHFSISWQTGHQLDEVTINTLRYSQKILTQSTRTGTTILTYDDINAIPAIGGEADIIKTLQLLPGAVRGMDGSADLFVRGGAADQNLVLLDGAPIYNASHLFGFLSVFNPDILEKAEAIHGGFPAEYGGRLSSIIDITSKNRIAQNTKAMGSIGLIASRIYIEQPLVKDKASIWVAGRRTYIDQAAKVIGENVPYFFYDLNGKVMANIGKRDHIAFSHYGGKDIFDLYRDNDDGKGFMTSYESGNNSQSLQWQHRSSRDWETNLNIIRSSFQYDINNSFGDNELIAFSNIEDIGAKLSFEKEAFWKEGALKTGVEWTRHALSPNVVNTKGNAYGLPEKSTTPGKTLHEMAAYIHQDWPLSTKLLINTGFRGSLALVGNKEYFTPEPRVSARYALANGQAVKLSYSRMAQYIHRVSNSAISMPTDIWYPVTDSILPQHSHQFSLAWQNFLAPHHLYIGVEAYYKAMENQIDYEEGTNLFLNPNFGSKLIQGRGQAYGLEFLLRKEAGKLTGWLSYTLSWSWRQFDGINKGGWFPARYDRRHNGAIVMQYQLHKRWKASLVWEYISGARFTPVVAQYVTSSPTLTGMDLIPIFSGINEVKLSDTHRLDLGIKYGSKPGKAFRWQWFIGVNNAYNRTNPIGIIIEKDEAGIFRYVQPGLFGLLPFISYEFEF